MLPRLLLISCCLFACLLPGQTPSYVHFGIQEGLPSNLIYCCARDNNGLMWFGTDKGLVCYDGIRFHTFGIQEGLPDFEVLNLYQDRSGRMWISCFSQRPCYMQNGKIITEREDPKLSKLEFKTGRHVVFEDIDSSIWFSDLAYFNYRFKNQTVEKNPMVRYLIWMEREGNDRIIYSQEKIIRVNSAGQQTELFKFNDQVNRLVGIQSVSIAGQYVLFGFDGAMCILERHGDVVKMIGQNRQTGGKPYTDRKGNFWVSSYRKGAIRFKPEDFNHPENWETFLPGAKVNAVFEDPTGSLWFCTATEGIYMLPANPAVTYSQAQGFYSNNITALGIGSRQEILAGDDQGNLYTLEDGTMSALSLGSLDGHNRVRKIIPVGPNECWVGADEGIYFKSSAGLRHYNLQSTVKDIEFRGRHLWFASSARLGYLDLNDQTEHYYQFERFTALCKDPSDNIWAGAMDGLYSLQDSFQYNWGNTFPMLKTRILQIKTDGKNYLWAATSDNGLVRIGIEQGRVISVEVANSYLEKPIQYIQSIFMESERSVWLAGNEGLFVLNDQWRPLRYDTYDGLINNDVNALVVQGDSLWAGTPAGLCLLTRESVQIDPSFPTFIVGIQFTTAQKRMNVHFFANLAGEKAFTLPGEARLISLNLAAPAYRARGKLNFRCLKTRMFPRWYHFTFRDLAALFSERSQRTDTTWTESGQLNFGINLPPGRYRIDVRAFTGRGIQSMASDVIYLNMPPQFYENIWFWLLVFASILLIIRRESRSRMEMSRLKAAASELQLQALKAQINPHLIGNSINAIQQFFYPPDPLGASKYIELFTRLLRRTMMYSERNFIPFGEEIDYIQDYLEMISLRFGPRFSYDIIGADQLSPDSAFPAMLLQPLLENATMHGLATDGVSRLSIAFTKRENHVYCRITDNGAGYKFRQEQKRLKGLSRPSKGLAILKQKIDTLNRLYNLNLELDIEDLSDHTPPASGTVASIRFIIPDSANFLQQHTHNQATNQT